MNKRIKLSLLGTLIATSTLAITLPIVSCSSSTSNDVKLTLVDESNVTNTVTKSLHDKIQRSGITNDEQVQIINSWIVDSSIPESALDSIKDILKFKDGDNKEFGYDDVVKSITFNSKTVINESGSITSPRLRVNFKDGYTGNIIIQVGDLGSVVPIVLTVDSSIMLGTVIAITNSLTNEMQKDGNKRKQMEIAEKWAIGSEVSREHLDSIREVLKFKNGNKEVSFDEAVSTITFTSETIIGNFNTIINGPKLRINFNDGYIGNIQINTNSLGNVAASELTINDDVMENVVNVVTKSLTNKMQTYFGGSTTRKLQEELAASWSVGKEIPIEELNLIKGILKFNDGYNDISYDEAVQSITFNSETIIGEFDTNIEGPTLRINFNDGYSSNTLIKIGTLGKVVETQVSTSSNILEFIVAANEQLTQLMAVAGDDRNSQLNIANSWLVGEEIPKVIFESFIPLLDFTDDRGVKYEYNEVIESFIFTKAAFVPPSFGVDIIGPNIKAIYKNGFKGNLEFSTRAIGTVGSIYLTPKGDSLNIAIDSVVYKYSDYFGSLGTRDLQERFAKSLTTGDDSIYKEKIIFIDSTGKTYDNNSVIIEKWIIDEWITIPPKGEPVKGPIIRIVFNENFKPYEDIIIDVGIIGIAL